MKTTQIQPIAGRDAGHTPGPWKYEPGTKTIRSVPANYWLATLDSWDGMVDNEANARLIAAAPDLLATLKMCLPFVERVRAQSGGDGAITLAVARDAIAKAERGPSHE